MRACCALALTASLCLSGSAAAQPPGLSMRDMFRLVTESPAAFERAWEGRFDAAAKGVEGVALAELRAARARGYVDFAYFHWRETGEAVPDPWSARRRAEAAVNIDDAAALERPEQRAFLDAWLRAEVRARLASDAALQTGDNRWLRARFAVVEARVREPLVRRRLLREALAAHIESNGVRGIPELIDRYAAITGAPAAETDPLRKSVADAIAQTEKHRVETYKTVDGVALEAHIFAPAAPATLAVPAAPAAPATPANSADPGPRPALIWFHGGSWNEGEWSHCPIVCRAARARGYVAIQIEYRTDERFASGPLAAIADGRDALAWVRAHAGELGVDRTRVVIGGFSSGGSIASLLATTSAPGDVRGAVLVSGCVAPFGDIWFRRMTEKRASEADLTPSAHLEATDPPTLAVHGDADEMCPYADTDAFVKAAKAAGVDAQLLTLPGATHFFPFRSPEARTRAAEAIEQFLDRRR